MSDLCINCKERPIEIKKRKLCKKCYQQKYISIHKKQVVWPLDSFEIGEDIKTEVKKHPRYKKYIKDEAAKVVKKIK